MALTHEKCPPRDPTANRDIEKTEQSNQLPGFRIGDSLQTVQPSIRILPPKKKEKDGEGEAAHEASL